MTAIDSGATVRAIRDSFKLSRRKLAELTGMTETRIFNIEMKDSWKAGDKERLERAFADLEANPPAGRRRGEDANERLDRLEERLRGNGHLLRESAEWEPADYQPELFSIDELELDAIGPLAASEAAPGQTPAEDAKVPQIATEKPLAAVLDDMLASGRPLTNSEAAAWLRCRRKWYAFWYRGLVFNAQDPSGPRAIGGRVHRALAAWYVPDGTEPVDPRAALEQAIQEDWQQIAADAGRFGEDQAEMLTIQRAKFDEACELERAIIEGYLAWLEETGSDSRILITGSEQTVTATIEGDVAGEPVKIEIMGKLDARFTRTSDGARGFVDHKSVQNFKEPQKTLHMDSQMLHYMLLEALTGDEDQPFSNTALYNMLRKVKRTANARPPFFTRLEIHHSPIELESYRKRLLGIGRDIRRATAELEAGADPLTIVYPTPNQKLCSWDCDLFPVCTMFDDGSRVEDAIAGLYHVEDPLARYGNQDPHE